ncbi:MAG: trehalose-phosphatase [Thermomicrobiales bacterium]|nr:trehalose-phosphatase [Thermomicrobiales bacterium]
MTEPHVAPLVVEPPSIGGVNDFWDRVVRAPSVALFLDFDGTLAPFHSDRMQAYPLPGSMDAIRAINDQPRTNVAIVSGRPISEIMTLIGELGMTISGAHGYEYRTPDGGYQVIPLPAEQRLLLDSAREMAMRIFPAERVERKAASVAAHVRGLDATAAADMVSRLEQQWRTLSDSDLVDFRPFNGGLELRAKGRTKGTVISEMLDSAPADILPIYIGDDDTDEDAFRALAGRGIGIKVGPANAVTQAIGHLDSCEAVRDMLTYWAGREIHHGAGS